MLARCGSGAGSWGLLETWTEKRTNESILMDIGQRRGDVSLRQRAAKQLSGHVMRANGLKNEMMLAGMQGRKTEERSSEEETDEGNAHNVRDGPGGAQGCGGGSRLMEMNDRDGLGFNESM